jgi:hypothetical protein
VVNKIALGGLLAMFAAGVWLIAAPFVVRYQPAGAPWTGPARLDVASSPRWPAGCGNCTPIGPSQGPRCHPG